MNQNDLQIRIFAGCGNTKRGQGEGNSGTGGDNGGNAERRGGGKNPIAILRQGIHSMTDGVQLDPDKLQILDAALHFAFISIAIAVRSHAGYAEEASWMLGAQVGNAVVR